MRRRSLRIRTVALLIGSDCDRLFICLHRCRAGDATRRRIALPASRRRLNRNTVDCPGSEGCHSRRILFETGDATNLRGDLGAFDIVHAANLICRLPEPIVLLDRLPSLVKPGGTLVLTTPCTWLGEFTAPEKWPDGPTLEWLQRSLTPAFTIERSLDMPFLIRETSRKFQWTVAEASVWKRQ